MLTTTTRMYAVPAVYMWDAREIATVHILDTLGPYDFSVRPTLTSPSLNNRTGEVERFVRVTGNDRVHGAMLSRFEWAGE